VKIGIPPIDEGSFFLTKGGSLQDLQIRREDHGTTYHFPDDHSPYHRTDDASGGTRQGGRP
jgi:hypothetical protein